MRRLRQSKACKSNAGCAHDCRKPHARFWHWISSAHITQFPLHTSSYHGILSAPPQDAVVFTTVVVAAMALN